MGYRIRPEILAGTVPLSWVLWSFMLERLFHLFFRSPFPKSFGFRPLLSPDASY